jgi:hypothetical protein
LWGEQYENYTAYQKEENRKRNFINLFEGIVYGTGLHFRAAKRKD